MNLSLHGTNQIRLLLRLALFYLSYCYLQKISFPDVPLPFLWYFVTWNSVYEFALTWYRTNSTFVPFDLLFNDQELLPFAKIPFFWTFFCYLSKYWLDNSSMNLSSIIHVKFNIYFCRIWRTFNWVIALCKNLVFRTFPSHRLWYRLGLFICPNAIQINFNFWQVWPNCIPVISYCCNIVFRTSLYRLPILTSHSGFF